MPTLKNCEKCGKVFNAEGADHFCADCNIAEAKALKKVQDFLRKSPLANVMEVHKQTGISQQQLFRFIKSGSLKMRKPQEDYKCRICGKAVKSGAMCGECREKVEKMQKKPNNVH